MNLELNHINILTGDMEESLAFYQEKLGMKVAARYFQEGVFDLAF